MASTIGIKTANGEFYPILEENSAVKKKLILTTVHHKQASVHIDLYKSDTRTIAEEGYIGSLIVEDIKSKPKGEPSIELIVASNEAGEITAEAVDLDAAAKGEPQYLHVSLKTKENKDPDFILDDETMPPPDKPGFPWGKAGLILLALLAVAFGIWCFLLGGLKTLGFKKDVQAQASLPEISSPAEAPRLPSPEAERAAAEAQRAAEAARRAEAERLAEAERAEAERAALAETSAAEAARLAEAERAEIEAAERAAAEASAFAETESDAFAAEATLPGAFPAETEPPIIEAPALPPPEEPPLNRTRTRPPVASYKVPAAIPRGGAAYKIRWGDTLWDISEAFYRNPWLYPRIARFNKIRNPDLIISGTTIRVPPKQ
ncbi:MAG: Hsp70 family protein [Spirochaetaceae bacterium]|jgi:nucleoid-associated protein YgaU|nr:Hsp70 family protein [Spirochaetaceae bacterium]